MYVGAIEPTKIDINLAPAFDWIYRDSSLGSFAKISGIGALRVCSAVLSIEPRISE